MGLCQGLEQPEAPKDLLPKPGEGLLWSDGWDPGALEGPGGEPSGEGQGCGCQAQEGNQGLVVSVCSPHYLGLDVQEQLYILLLQGFQACTVLLLGPGLHLLPQGLPGDVLLPQGLLPCLPCLLLFLLLFGHCHQLFKQKGPILCVAYIQAARTDGTSTGWW